jgi:hypothetical protein
MSFLGCGVSHSFISPVRGFEPDEPPWSASVGSIHVAVRVEPHILNHPPAGESEGARHTLGEWMPLAGASARM